MDGHPDANWLHHSDDDYWSLRQILPTDDLRRLEASLESIHGTFNDAFQGHAPTGA